ncbi:expressed protein [Echinococcus multilocularis]|uniref:Expressed protein n=1 Tax=Echinococcus multilocularis TaxID=6211 RepID=A0A068YC46_ECHMU|nr:expressed protein [Echinococcus multilocularis]
MAANLVFKHEGKVFLRYVEHHRVEVLDDFTIHVSSRF